MVNLVRVGGIIAIRPGERIAFSLSMSRPLCLEKGKNQLCQRKSEILGQYPNKLYGITVSVDRNGGDGATVCPSVFTDPEEMIDFMSVIFRIATLVKLPWRSRADQQTETSNETNRTELTGRV